MVDAGRRPCELSKSCYHMVKMAARKHVFTQIEKKVFLDVLKTYSAIVENKNTDGSTLRDKNVAWDNITREYNASPHVTTEVSNKQLRRLWMNLKQRQRDALTKERQHHMATGGGPSTSIAEIDADVAQIAPGLMVEIPGAIDSDTIDSPVTELIVVSQDMDSQPDLSLEITQEPPSQINMQISPEPSPTTSNTPFHNTTIPPNIFTGLTTTQPTTSTPSLSIPIPPPSTTSSSTTSFLRHRNSIVDKEYQDRFNRASEIHLLEKELLQYKIREAKAKAELAELILQRERLQEGTQ